MKKEKINKKNENELHIAFSLGSIIDTKKAEEALEKDGVKGFHEILRKHKERNSIFSPGPALGFFMALRNLNKVIPSDVLRIKFALITKIDPNPAVSAVIIDSMKHYLEENEENNMGLGFDMIMMTNGKCTNFCHKVFDTDLMFTTSEKSAKELFKIGVSSVCIPNVDFKTNKELYEKRKGNIVLFTDYDGVIGDAESEKVFQASLKESNNNKDIAISTFLAHEQKNKDVAMELGPLGKVIKKLGRVISYQKQRQLNFEETTDLMNIVVVTARGGESTNRLFKTMEDHELEISELYMLQGQNKNDILKEMGEIYKGYNLLFFDDSVIHFKRSLELRNIASAWVPNDENTL